MNKFLSGSLVALALSGVAFGQSVSYQTYIPAAFNPNLPSGLANPPAATGGVGFGSPASATLPQWDPTLYPAGTALAGVTYELTGFAYINYTFFDSPSATASLGLGPSSFATAQVAVSGPGGASLISDVNFSVGGIAVPSSGTVESGPKAAGSQAVPNTAPYIGNGTVTFNLTSDGFVTVGSANGVDAQTFPFAGALVKVTYQYRIPEVPEASTYAAVGFLAALGGWSVYRRRQA